ncbi:uncharacterized protein LOC133309884 isoform X2 [Gastrolobium bilobum]|uniref:uncharacterized protein LOC133309884 isoform X2 n=1 Tax=Gastrolobium bilobum TaxID=150636 RepID=UPI002AB18871|nr:uncharacterized protein LOC133309884 isoform X2 [Gastrolobium bilobum]
MEENNNPFMTHQSSSESDDHIPSQPLDLNKPHPSKDFNMEEQEQEGPFSYDDSDKDVTKKPSSSKTLLCNKEKITMHDELVSVSAVDVEKEGIVPEAMGEDSGRERLKRHGVEVAGMVLIPDIWGQEELLKDWIDCTAFDAPIVPSRITMAREALVQESTRANAAGLRIENRESH